MVYDLFSSKFLGACVLFGNNIVINDGFSYINVWFGLHRRQTRSNAPMNEISGLKSTELQLVRFLVIYIFYITSYQVCCHSLIYKF